MLSHPQIPPAHLAKQALVSVWQSTPTRVLHKQERQRWPYALVERARALGWHQLEGIEDALGHSASAGTPRVGFKKLLATVVLGEVGIVLRPEVSRLSRTEKEWGHVLAICTVCEIFIGDAEHVDDVHRTADQLLLGRKGPLRVLEASGLQSRLFQGQEHKATRGDLYKLVAPGYLCVDGKSRGKDPNGRVQEAIAWVFAKFRALWSVRQVFQGGHEEGRELPVHKSIPGKVQRVGHLPTYHAVKYILQNPVYAGASVYGQRHTPRARGEDNEELTQLQEPWPALQEAIPPLSETERQLSMALGRPCRALWCSDECAMALKKQILRILIREIMVRRDADTQDCTCMMPWQGGCHPTMSRKKPLSGAIQDKTPEQDVALIRHLSVRYDDGEIARGRSKLGRTTARGKRWHQTRVAYPRKQ